MTNNIPLEDLYNPRAKKKRDRGMLGQHAVEAFGDRKLYTAHVRKTVGLILSNVYVLGAIDAEQTARKAGTDPDFEKRRHSAAYLAKVYAELGQPKAWKRHIDFGTLRKHARRLLLQANYVRGAAEGDPANVPFGPLAAFVFLSEM